MIDLDTVLRLARQAGAYWEYSRSFPVPCVFSSDEELVKFAELIEAELLKQYEKE